MLADEISTIMGISCWREKLFEMRDKPELMLVFIFIKKGIKIILTVFLKDLKIRQHTILHFKIALV